MRIQTETNLAKRILCLALCAIMLIAMLPVMTVPAYAEPDGHTPGIVVVKFQDALSGAEISSSITLSYEDLTDGVYSVEVPDITGYTKTDVYEIFYPGDSYVPDTETGGGEERRSLGVQDVIEGRLYDATGYAEYRVLYQTNKAENGYVSIRVFTDVYAPPSWTEYYYYDDMTSGEYSIDLNKPSYRIVGVYDETGDAEISAPANGILTGTLTQGDTQIFSVGYEPDTSTASFNAVLLLDENASVPSATINYSITPGTGIAAVPGTSMEIIAPSAENGVTGTPTISNAVFAPGDATVTSVDGVTIDAGEKAVVKPVTIDFSNVSFAQPGIFRYVISEPSSGNNMTYDTQLNDTTNGTRYQRVLDVYVVRNASNEYEIGGYVMHEVANAPAEGATAASDKSSGFVNEYNTSGITLECLVTGNQSSVEKYFKFNVAITNPGGSQFSSAIDWSNAAEAKNPVENPATTYSQSDIASANEANTWTSTSTGVLEKVVYLKHGQKIEIPGLPIGATYHIDVLEEDYGPTWDIKIAGTVKDQPAGSDPLDDTENQTLGERIEDVRFILTRDGVVPTGIMLSALPGVIIMGSAAAVLFVMKNRKKEEGAEA